MRSKSNDCKQQYERFWKVKVHSSIHNYSYKGCMTRQISSRIEIFISCTLESRLGSQEKKSALSCI